jgi:hypothetical protein
MIKLFMILALLVGLSITPFGDSKAAIEDHPRFATLQTWVDSMINTISDAQAKHFSRHGFYFQGLKTPTQVCDGENHRPISYGLKPTDQEESWADFAPGTFKYGVKFPASVKINVMETPKGWAYSIKFEIIRPGLGPDNYGNDGDNWIYQTWHGPDKPADVWDEWFIDAPPVMP